MVLVTSDLVVMTFTDHKHRLSIHARVSVSIDSLARSRSYNELRRLAPKILRYTTFLPTHILYFESNWWIQRKLRRKKNPEVWQFPKQLVTYRWRTQASWWVHKVLIISNALTKFDVMYFFPYNNKKCISTVEIEILSIRQHLMKGGKCGISRYYVHIRLFL